MTDVYAIRGHGRKPDGTEDPGAVGRDATGKLWTEQLAADIAVPAMVRRLRSAGVDVIDEGPDDPNYVGSTRAANASGAKLAVSLHCDWTGGLDAHVLHYPGSAGGTALASAIVARWEAAGIPTAGTRDRDELYLLKRTTMPAVIVELGRIGSAAIDTPAELERLGELVAHGILDHLGIDPPTPPTPPPADAPRDGWRWPEHAERLLDAGVYTGGTAPGVNVDTDNLSAYLDRLLRLVELRDRRQTERIAELAAAPSTAVDVEAVAAAVAELLEIVVE